MLINSFSLRYTLQKYAITCEEHFSLSPLSLNFSKITVGTSRHPYWVTSTHGGIHSFVPSVTQPDLIVLQPGRTRTGGTIGWSGSLHSHTSLGASPRKIRLIECNAKCRYLKSLPVKGLCGRCFFCLSPPPLLWPHIPQLTHCIREYSILIHKGKERRGGQLTREKVRGAKIPTWLTVSPVYKLY